MCKQAITELVKFAPDEPHGLSLREFGEVEISAAPEPFPILAAQNISKG